MSCITPPVAVAAFAASTIAGSLAMDTVFRTMRDVGILFALPFMFGVNLTLILLSELMAILHDVVTAVIVALMLAYALEGWLYFSGRLIGPFSFVLAIAAFGPLYPGTMTDLICLGPLAVVYIANKFRNARVTA